MPGYKHPCKYCGKLVSFDDNVCPFCGKVNPVGPKDAQNAETQSKQDKSNAAAAA